ncbi:helix-turn-helix transcriptional regulator [Paenibacillus sp. NRS-1760]|uniref:helix-turn-helix transcriptional regulator n=1 Tax=Paenibacillus sp. NRS-1760 TaxID=3233902 RepID=UPI003D2C2E7C
MLLANNVKLKDLLNGNKMDTSSFLHIAIALTESVHKAHKQNLLIGHLNPAGILIQSEINSVVLTDERIIDYAYLSPEQTGRINRKADERSDLYAIGMIFYHMLAGRLPFQAQNREEWLHAHLAIVPMPLREVRLELEDSLENIIMKLLSKRPEDRYQSAFGLLFDLKSCASSMEKKGEIIPFEIARVDEASRFQLPKTLFGREMEGRALREVLQQAQAGVSSFVFVSGSAGSGKTALIREFQVLARKEGSLFIGGKCDLMNRDVPLSPLLQALRSLIRQIYSQSPERMAKLKLQLEEALGQGAAVIVQLLPEAAKLFGELPSVEPLPPAEAAIRFHRLIPLFMNIFAEKEHPLLIFLDDLQWADSATLDVLRSLAHAPNRLNLLVLGTFRVETASGCSDNGANQGEAAVWMENTLNLQHASSSIPVQHIALEALTYLDVRQVLSHVLNENSARVRTLAEVLYHRTGGNPLFVHRLLDSLYRENKLYYDEEAAIWNWDGAAVAQIPEHPDILHLIGTRIRMLSPDMVELLAIGAAIGHRFHSSTIALVSGRSPLHTLQLLRLVEEEGLLSREIEMDDAAADEGYYTFMHDRVQQAAYMTIAEAEKASLHLTIGRVLRDHSLEEREHSIYDVVYHLNMGSDKLVNEAEKMELAEYNYQAGLKSKAATAFAAALHFFEKGLQLAGGDWRSTSSLAYRLMLELPECEFMCRRIDKAEALLEQLMSCTTDLVERSQIYLKRIAMYSYLKNDELAVHIGKQALAEFGWIFSSKPSKAVIVKELIMTQGALFSMRHEIMNLPINRNPEYKALSDLVMAISSSVFTLSLELSAVLFSRFIRYALKHGSNEAFAFMLAGYGMIIFKISFYHTGPQYIDLAFKLSASFESSDLRSRLHYIKGLVGLQQNPEASAKHFEQSIYYGMESINLSYVSIAMLTSTTTHTGDLHTLTARISNYEEISQQLLDEVTVNVFRIARWYVAQMQDGAGEYDEVVVPLLKDRFEEKLNNEVYYTCTSQIEIAYLFGRYHDALEWVEKGKFNTYRQTRMQVRKQHIYHSLTLAAMYAEAAVDEQKGIRAKLNKQLRSMRQWTGYYGNESSAYLLITAELHRIDGDRVNAAKGFEGATREARREGNGLMEAISCERASIFYREAGSITGADVLIADACAAYSRWGATAKAKRLMESNSKLKLAMAELQTESVAATEEIGQVSTIHETTPMFVDEKAFIRQITDWSRKADDSNVMSQFLESALRYSGAEKGYVLESHEEIFTIADHAGTRNESDGEVSYAEAIVRYVVKTGDSVVLANASRSSYAADPYITRSKSQSVLCMPVSFPGTSLKSVLYLENNLFSDVFTKEILEVLDLMIARMVYLKSSEEFLIQSSASASSSDSEYSPLDNADNTAEPQPLVELLTNREAEILYALTDGLSNKEIAYRFGLKESTVKSYVFHLYGKLGVKRRSQAIARAKELELVT